MRVDLWLLGYRTYRVPLKEATLLFEWWRSEGFSPKGLIRDEKRQEIRFSCTLLGAKRLLAKKPSALTLVEIACGGLPLLLAGLCKRPGLLCGLVLALVLLTASHLFVWDVRVIGNETISQEELCRELAAVGLQKGRFLPLIRGDDIAAALRCGDSRVSYATVNLQGTVAYVQIRESELPEREGQRLPANLVARRDGTVVLPLIFEGEVLVKEGEVVRAGQMLASGMIDTDNHGYRLTRAAGQVLAKTTQVYRVTVPFSYEEKVFTGRSEREVSLLFFGGAQKVFKNISKNIEKCDIIEKTRWFALGEAVLPFGFSVTERREYTTVTATRTAREAHAQALLELEAALAADSAGRTLLSRTTEVVADAQGITLICTVVCEEDIAKTVEITTD